MFKRLSLKIITPRKLAIVTTGVAGLQLQRQLEGHEKFLESHPEKKSDRPFDKLGPRHLLAGNIENTLSPNQKYAFSAAIKALLEQPHLGKAGFVHVAISIQRGDGKYLLLGRHGLRNDICDETKHADSSRIDTENHLVNEKGYFVGLVPYLIPVGPDLPKVTPEELKAGETYVSDFCTQQNYALFSSNCATAAYIFTAGVIQEVMKREDSLEKSRTIEALRGELTRIASQNYGVGLIDNPAVQKAAKLCLAQKTSTPKKET